VTRKVEIKLIRAVKKGNTGTMLVNIMKIEKTMYNQKR